MYLNVHILSAQPRNLPLEFTHIQEGQGLSYNFINCLLQDHGGYLWIGTYGGLNRFDGTHFVIFKADHRKPNSLGNNVIHDLSQDKAGTIWIATDDGISAYDSRTGLFRNIHSVGGIALGRCMNIVCDRKGRIWFSSLREGLFRFDPLTAKSTRFKHDPTDSTSLSANRISKNGLLEDPHRDGLWLTTEETGLNYLDIPSGRFSNYRHNPKKLAVFRPHDTSALVLDGTNRLIFADNTDQRILVYDLAAQQITNTITLKSQTGRPAFPMATIVVDQGHNLWVSSWWYTMFTIESSRYQAREFAHDATEKTSIAGDFFWAGWTQPDGTIWFGTVNGLSHTNPGQTFYQVHNLARLHPALANGHGITSFLEDSTGNWWLTAGQELFYYKPVTGRLTVYKLSTSPRNDYRFSLPALVSGFKRDELYIGRKWSLEIFNKRTRSFTPFPLPPQVFKRADGLSALVRQGKWLWLFGTSDVVFSCHLPSGSWHTYTLPFGANQAKVKIRSAGLDKNGRLWADVETKGLIWFSAAKQRFVAHPVQQQTTGYTDHYAFSVDSRNRLWIPASGQGLIEFDPTRRTYRTWTEQDGLCSNECKAACTDAYGQIWMASYNKVSILNPDRSSVRNFTMSINEANISYVDYMFPLHNGNILTALKSYVVEFMPHRIARQSAPANVLISSLTLPDTSLLIHLRSPALQLGVSENNFSISYSVLNRTQQSYTYFYRLDGYDDGWVRADARTVANYTKIPGGDYTFRVKAVAGSTETGETQLAIHVDTVFYKTRWFGAALLGLVLLMAYWLYRTRIRQTARRHHFQMQMTRLERDKAEIQYHNLINHLNPHFLFNSLTSLNSLILTRPKEASLFLRKLSLIYRYILQNKDSELVSLQDELAFAQNYIDLQKSRFGEGLEIGINMAPETLALRIVPVTIQNLLENAIKHNIVSDESPLRIQIYTEADTLYVTNALQKKGFVETSNKQGLNSLRSLYHYLSPREVAVTETPIDFSVAIPLL